MRCVPMTSTLACALALVLGKDLAPAQAPSAPKGPDVRYVIRQGAEVRSGPSTASQFYVTNHLAVGEAVEVVQERPDGWLAIRPPKESFSWINTRFLQHIVPNQDNWVVVREGVEVPVLIGSALRKDKPTVIGAHVQRGTQVRSIGQPKADEEGNWMPIAPPPGEVRFLRVETVSRVPPETPPGREPAAPNVPASRSSQVVRQPGSVSPLGSSPSGSEPVQASFAPAPEQARSIPATVDVDGLWRRAQQAHQNQQWEEAITLYTHLGTLDRYDAVRAMEARNRAYDLRNALREGRLRPTRRSPTRHATQVARPLTPQNQAPPLAQNAASFRPAGEAPGNARPWQGDSTDVEPKNGTWVGPGRLRLAGRWVDGQQAYVLEMGERSIPRYYVIAGPGIDLSRFQNYWVYLYGPGQYRGDIRAWHMTALAVRPAK
jgi:hypothetical protein